MKYSILKTKSKRQINISYKGEKCTFFNDLVIEKLSEELYHCNSLLSVARVIRLETTDDMLDDLIRDSDLQLRVKLPNISQYGANLVHLAITTSRCDFHKDLDKVILAFLHRQPEDVLDKHFLFIHFLEK